ncbi:MAG: hypothetical protein EOP07_07720 [Proteobacteria bacterium]|nr:MAG: hypothetical protein EOP07_07720 [Pseudomonadota bacterium]
MRQMIRIVQLTIILFVSISCNKLTQKNAATPIDFDGLKRIQASAGGSFILSWDLPKQAQIENFEVYIQGIDADKAKALNATSLQNSLGSKFSLTSDTTPSTTGSLTRLVASNETSYKSEPLDEGYWLFEVKALGKSGLRDAASSVILLQVLPSDAFGGLLIAGVEGTNVNLKEHCSDPGQGPRL